MGYAGIEGWSKLHAIILPLPAATLLMFDDKWSISFSFSVSSYFLHENEKGRIPCIIITCVFIIIYIFHRERERERASPEFVFFYSSFSFVLIWSWKGSFLRTLRIDCFVFSLCFSFTDHYRWVVVKLMGPFLCPLIIIYFPSLHIYYPTIKSKLPNIKSVEYIFVSSFMGLGRFVKFSALLFFYNIFNIIIYK